MDKEEILKAIKHAREDEELDIRPLLNMDEYEDSYQMEIVMPGINRDEIIVYMHNNILSVWALHKECHEAIKKKLKIHEFDKTCFQRHIQLPPDADREFIATEFKKGILNIKIPKTKDPVSQGTRLIIVY